MKIFVDGIEIPNPTGSHAIIITAEAPQEEMGPITIRRRGGEIWIRPDGTASITVTNEDGISDTLLGDRTDGHFVPRPFDLALDVTFKQIITDGN